MATSAVTRSKEGGMRTDNINYMRQIYRGVGGVFFARERYGCLGEG